MSGCTASRCSKGGAAGAGQSRGGAAGAGQQGRSLHREATDELGQEAVADQVVHRQAAAAEHRVRLGGGCGRLRALRLQLGAEADRGGLGLGLGLGLVVSG